MPVLPLTKSQRDAIAARGNVLVVAGAGTGKTSTLVERCLAVLEEGTSLENILMVTFTDAAAAEMRGRIREALRDKLILLRGHAHRGPAGSWDPSCSLSPHPRGEGESSTARPPIEAGQIHPAQHGIFPLPKGEGQGEGEGDDRPPRGSSSASDRSDAEKLRDHFEKQLALLDVARISTLHSFCLQLVREHFYELGIDPDVTVLDETQTRPLIRQTLDAIFERHYASDTEMAKAVQSLVRGHGRGSDEAIRALVLKLHRYTQSLPAPDRWLTEQMTLYSEPEPTQWRTWFCGALLDWAKFWQHALEPFAGPPAVMLCQQALKNLAASSSFSEVAQAIRAMRAADAEVDHWPSGSKTTVRNQLKFFFADVEFLASLLPSDDADPLAEDWQFARQPMLTLIALAREFADEFSRVKRALGGVEFADLEQFALRLLRDLATNGPTPIACAWRERLEYIFVDEYQDINGAQDAILIALSRDGERANRFLVGDVKQSIYRFRLANPAIFRGYEQKWREGTDHGCRISLADNFRSHRPMLDFVNALFGLIMRPDAGGVNYEALMAGRTDEPQRPPRATAPEPCVELHLIAKGDDENEDIETAEEDVKPREDLADLRAVEREARLVALRLFELHRQGHEIWDKSERRARPIRWSDMAVLLRSPAGRAEAFAMEFHRVGVPLQAARSNFFQCLEVSDLHGLLKLIDNPLQDIPLLAVLRSPLVGMSVEELGEVRAHSREPNFWFTLRRFHREAARQRLEKAAASAWDKTDLFLRQFENWRESVRHTSLSTCLETALTETHYEALLLAGARGEQRLANVRRFVDLARQYDPYQRQGLFRFLRFTAEQEDSEADFEPASALTENAVRLLSIHKSKGLEFPVVVVAGLGTRFNFRDLSEDVLLDEEYGLCPKVSPPESEQRYPSLPHWLARQRQCRELLAEEMRLFYVATTRARDLLILTASAIRKTDPEWSAGAPPAERQTILSARCCLDWLRAWLSQATRGRSNASDRDELEHLLRWTIYSETDSRLSIPADVGQASSLPVREASCLESDGAKMPREPADKMSAPRPTDESVLRQLSERLTWEYPFRAASEACAKTSVTQLRRLREDEENESQAAPFIRRNAFSIPARPVSSLNAADVGVAHHVFLEHLDLRGEPTLDFLRREADRLAESRLLTTEHRLALDLASVAAFWNSGLGQKIRAADASAVRRELPFTARFSPGVLRATGLPVSAGLKDDEWVVVQGVVDLAVILPGEIWLIDFKTDDLRDSEVAAKVETYRPQLQLYAQALGQIYRRPVTERWLHFLKLRRTMRA
jgi:ATP-dependent helicase/nuclease subunit A